MITAQEAAALFRKKWDISEALSKIESQIKLAIDHRQKSAFYYIDTAVVFGSHAQVPPITEFNKELKTTLEKYGYAVTYGEYGEAYIPRGSHDDEYVISYGLEIQFIP